MFYDTSAFRKPLAPMRDDRTHALIMLLPRESKRLIAKGVVAVPEVKRVLDSGYLVVSRGVTPAYILEELTGLPQDKGNCTAGIVTSSRLASVLEEDRLGPWVFKDGKLSEEPAPRALANFRARDVSIKGANAVDPQGNIVVVNVNSTDVHTFSPDGQLVGTEHAVDPGNDGLVILDDGTKYVCSVRQGTVSRIRPGQPAEIVASGIPSAASMAYDSRRHRLIIPLNNWNAVTFVDLD